MIAKPFTPLYPRVPPRPHTHPFPCPRVILVISNLTIFFTMSAANRASPPLPHLLPHVLPPPLPPQFLTDSVDSGAPTAPALARAASPLLLSLTSCLHDASLTLGAHPSQGGQGAGPPPLTTRDLFGATQLPGGQARGPAEEGGPAGPSQSASQAAVGSGSGAGAQPLGEAAQVAVEAVEACVGRLQRRLLEAADQAMAPPPAQASQGPVCCWCRVPSGASLCVGQAAPVPGTPNSTRRLSR
jgi:hypothetical protein